MNLTEKIVSTIGGTMLKQKTFVFIILGIMIVIAQACNLPGAAPATQTPQTLDPLAAAQLTIAAAASQNQTPGDAGVTPSATLILAPTLTATPAFTATSAFTSTPSFSYVTLSVATNCRSGPGKAFDLIDTFLPGQTIEVLGKNPTGDYWYVRSPNNQSVFCWLWGYYSTGGNLGNVALFTPPPTPTSVPSYEVSYTGLDSCFAAWWVEVSLKNAGAIAFKSLTISVKDTVSGVSVSSSNNEFINNDGCVVFGAFSRLDPGETYIVSSPPFAANPTGHKVTATLTLCTEDNLGGQCSSKNIEFTP
jgi:hypothetical protein